MQFNLIVHVGDAVLLNVELDVGVRGSHLEARATEQVAAISDMRLRHRRHAYGTIE